LCSRLASSGSNGDRACGGDSECDSVGLWLGGGWGGCCVVVGSSGERESRDHVCAPLACFFLSFIDYHSTSGSLLVTRSPLSTGHLLEEKQRRPQTPRFRSHILGRSPGFCSVGNPEQYIRRSTKGWGIGLSAVAGTRERSWRNRALAMSITRNDVFFYMRKI
jgi:hypothetical protein